MPLRAGELVWLLVANLQEDICCRLESHVNCLSLSHGGLRIGLFVVWIYLLSDYCV